MANLKPGQEYNSEESSSSSEEDDEGEVETLPPIDGTETTLLESDTQDPETTFLESNTTVPLDSNPIS